MKESLDEIVAAEELARYMRLSENMAFTLKRIYESREFTLHFGLESRVAKDICGLIDAWEWSKRGR